MRYLLALIAGLWLADGLAFLVAPRRIMDLLKQALELSPTLVRWGGLAALLGIILLVGGQGLRYQPLWAIVGIVMMLKGLFLTFGPDGWRRLVLAWCLQRDEVDYRFWGLGLCALAILLLDALGWLQGE